MKRRGLRIVLGAMFALLAVGAFNTQTAEAGHRYRYRRAYVPRYAPRYYAPRYIAPRYVVPAYPRYGGVYYAPTYRYPSYGFGVSIGYGGGFCY